MLSRFVKGAVCVGVAGLASLNASAVVIYDSGGFEAPRFTPGPLTGQDGGSWMQSPAPSTGTAIVQSAVKFAGNQAVQVTRAANNDRYFPDTPVVTPTPAQRYITIDWKMNVTEAVHAGNFGPFFGIEAYDPTSKVIGALGVDAKTGEVVFYDAANQGVITPTGDVVDFGTWHQYTLALDFVSKNALLYVDGQLTETVTGFVDENLGAITQFFDADIAALPADVEPPLQTGVAYFDDYVVQNVAAVPEPATLSLLACGLLMLGRRRIVKSH